MMKLIGVLALQDRDWVIGMLALRGGERARVGWETNTFVLLMAVERIRLVGEGTLIPVSLNQGLQVLGNLAMGWDRRHSIGWI
jgi:hypothetical protein